ncbi:hypothetical protein [Trebonia kvetii]|nr:hypothetical protein [Trebonia kvetii]
MLTGTAQNLAVARSLLVLTGARPGELGCGPVVFAPAYSGQA